MSIKTSRPFRILALPLVRIPHGPLRVTPRIAAASPSGAGSSTSTAAADLGAKAPAKGDSAKPSTPGAVDPSPSEAPLMLYHVQQPDPASEGSGKQPFYQKALDKAAAEWNKLGKKPHNSWMYWFHAKGEKLMDRIDYEEWALKAVHENRGVKIADPKKGEKQDMIEIPLLRPTLPKLGLPPLLPKLHRSLLHKIPLHKKSMIRCLVLSPLTWPFAIIPVIPNFPLFYVLWRAWSHYKAWRGATYLESLLKLGMIVEKPSEQLNAIYESTAAQAPRGSENSAPDNTRAPRPNEEPAKEGGKPGPADVASPAAAAPLPAQAKGESVGAGDGTSTPEELIFNPGEEVKAAAKDAADEKKAAGEPAPTARYPGMMIVVGQIPALERDFDLRDQEVIDIERAIVQADHRAREAEKVLGLQEEGKKERQ